ncbi:MAG: outer membrane protein assembly factor BamD [Bryobacterales bacterium]|nr:outer membrane protein assembly factor BamD [Bryobacterales bacterium]
MNPRLAILLTAALLAPLPGTAQKREIVELQRDVATMQDQLRTLQRSFDEKMTAMTVLVQQTLDAANNANKSVAVLESRTRDQMESQEKKLTGPVAGLGTKVDQMSGDFRAVQQSMNDVVSRLGRLEQRLTDMSNEMRTMQSAPPPPPPGGDPAAALGEPPMPAGKLYESALRDTRGGRTELALQQFADYLRYFADTEMAPNAQFWIGQIYYDAAQYEPALENFDLVLTKFPQNNKTVDAMYMKGQTLLKMDRRTEAANEFRRLQTEYPKSPVAPKACSQLRSLGYRCPAGAPAARK